MHEAEGGSELTVLNIADPDLLENLWPHGSMDLLVLGDELGLQLYDLCNPAAGVSLPRRLAYRLPSRGDGSIFWLRGGWGPQHGCGGVGGGGSSGIAREV